MSNSRLRALAAEYLWYIDAMASGEYEEDARRTLSAQRAIVHDELIRLLGSGHDRPFDMAAYCRGLATKGEPEC